MKELKILEIPIEDIEDSPYYSRKFEEFDEQDIKQLAKSFEKNGLLHPIVVRENPGVGKKYQLISGKRRKKAFALTGENKILARIVEADDLEAQTMSLAENYHRKDLSISEKEKSIYKLWIYGNERGIFNFITNMEEWTGIPHQILSDIINAEKEKELDKSDEIQFSSSKDLQRTRALKDIPLVRKELLKGAVIKKTVKILEIADAVKIIKNVIKDLDHDILVEIANLFTEKKLRPNNLEDFINIIISIPKKEDQERIIKKINKDSEEYTKLNIYQFRRFVDAYNMSFDDVKSRLLNYNISIEEAISLNYFKARDQREKILEVIRNYDKEIKSIEKEKIKYIKDAQKLADSFLNIEEKDIKEYVIGETEESKKENKIMQRIYKIRKDLIFFNYEEINNYDSEMKKKAIEMLWEVYKRYREILIELGEMDNINNADDIYNESESEYTEIDKDNLGLMKL